MIMAYIEDDATTQEIMTNLLQHYGIKTLSFLKFEKFEEKKPEGLDLILTDGNIYDKSALEVYAFKLEHYKNTPIWLYSGNDSIIQTFKALQLPTYEKPRDMTKLLHNLKVYNSQVQENKYNMKKYNLRTD